MVTKAKTVLLSFTITYDHYHIKILIHYTIYFLFNEIMAQP